MKTESIRLLILLLITVGFLSAVKPTVVSPTPTTTDGKAARQTVIDFLHWYQTNIGAISAIYLVNQRPGQEYSVNFTNTERYLTYLKSSHRLTEHYLNEWRIYFKQRESGFRLTHQNEGPPTGFEYDLVMLTQDVDKAMESLKTLKITSVKIKQNRASVKFFLLEDYEFRLVKKNNRWVINDILNLSAE